MALQDQTSLLSLPLEALPGEGYRRRQLAGWLYEKGARQWDEMTDLPRALRSEWAERFRISEVAEVMPYPSQDGSVKYLYTLLDGQKTEAVYMPYPNRKTICISSMVGCPAGCTFCATGRMGFGRNLTAAEILDQILLAAHHQGHAPREIRNVVLMGMGEPLHNYENTLRAIRRLNDPNGLNIGQRHITLSTVGLVPEIKRFAEEGLQVGLAISLHAATDAERSALLPINRRYPIREVLEAAHYYVAKTGRRVTFEWALIRGENDTVEQAERLGALLRGLLCHVNLIPLNPTGGYGGAPSDPARVEAFQAVLARHGISSTVRVRRGIDIQAGCGQLKTEVLRRQRTRRTAS